MKRNLHQKQLSGSLLDRLGRIMHGSCKNMAVLMLALPMVLPAHAQSAKVSINANSLSIKEVLSEIEQQTDYLFVYNKSEIDLAKIVHVQSSGRPVSEVLVKAFADTGITYAMEGNNIMLIRQPVGDSPIGRKGDKIVVSGVVRDANGETVIGANVIEKGADNNGTTTDIDGAFSLDVAENAVLQISYIGYRTEEVAVRAGQPLAVSLKEDSEQLEDVVVVGYGIQKKVNLTGSVASVNDKKLANRPLTSLSAGLQGLVPGMTIVQHSGQPGSDGGTIRVRGVGTLNNSNPLVLIDGFEASIDDVNPNDVSSISVLKDAASSAIYGSKAANGVILITTKRGENTDGRIKVEYKTNMGWAAPTFLSERMSSADYAELYNEALAYDNKTPRWSSEEIELFRNGSDPYNYPNTDWQKLFFIGSGFQQRHDVSLKGGSQKVKYMASAGYNDQNGIIKHTTNTEYSGRMNLDLNPNDKLSLSFNISYLRKEQKEPTNPLFGGMDQIFRQVNRAAPWIPYKNEDGSYGTYDDGNPIAWMDLGATKNRNRDRFQGIGSLTWQFLPQLSVKGSLSYKKDVDDIYEFRKDIQYNDKLYHGPNMAFQTDRFASTVTSEVLLNYKQDFGKHSLGGFLGFHSELYKYKNTDGSRQNFPNNIIGDINAGSKDGMTFNGYTRELAMISFFGRINYNYANKYLLEANLRADASSRFAKNNRWGYFPSVSVGWVVTQEPFMDGVRGVLNNLKIRASWGQLGNQTMADYYPSIPTIDLGVNYPFGGMIIPGAAYVQAKKNDISWERSSNYDIGLDLTMFDGLSMVFDYYHRETSDILILMPAPATFGKKGYFDNVGKMANSGVELTVNYNKSFKDFSFGVGANVTFNKNEILDLGGDEYIMDGKNMIKKVGESFGALYGYRTAGLFQTQEEIDNWPKYKMNGKKVMPGDLKYVDINNDGVVDANDREVIGDTNPKMTFGFNLSAEYKGFYMSAMFQGAAKVGSYLELEALGAFTGDTGHPLTIWKDRFHPEKNPNGKMPRVAVNGPSLANLVVSDFWVQNGNYLRMKDFQIGYNFPKKLISKLGLQSLRIYYSGQNLWTITNMLKGYDPESPSGKGVNYPQVKVNSFGINLSF